MEVNKSIWCEIEIGLTRSPNVINHGGVPPIDAPTYPNELPAVAITLTTSSHEILAKFPSWKSTEISYLVAVRQKVHVDESAHVCAGISGTSDTSYWFCIDHRKRCQTLLHHRVCALRQNYFFQIEINALISCISLQIYPHERPSIIFMLKMNICIREKVFTTNYNSVDLKFTSPKSAATKIATCSGGSPELTAILFARAQKSP